MALYIFILVGFLFAKAEDEVLQSLQFLQTHVGLNTTSQRSHNETALAARGICVTDDKLTVKDLEDPVLEVMARYGEDGYCVFGNFSDCLSECALGRRARDPSYYPSWLTPIYSEILNRSWSTPVTLNFFDGRTVVIRDHYFPADDLYCIAMGWYDLPWATRFAVVKNLTFLEELSEDSDGTGKIPEWVVKNQYRHAAAKCVLGGNRGALCDIANCAQRGCFGEDKTTLLYTVRGECPSPLSG